MSVQWHEKGLVNMRATRDEMIRKCIRQEQDLLRIKAQVDKLEQQIARAKQLGKTGFDDERFLKG